MFVSEVASKFDKSIDFNELQPLQKYFISNKAEASICDKSIYFIFSAYLS